MALELREQNAFPESHRDPSTVDERMGGSGTNTDIAQSGEYTGPKTRGPSNGWIKLRESEKVISSVTPLVLAQRSHLGLPPPRVAHRRRLIKRETQNVFFGAAGVSVERAKAMPAKISRQSIDACSFIIDYHSPCLPGIPFTQRDKLSFTDFWVRWESGACKLDLLCGTEG